MRRLATPLSPVAQPSCCGGGRPRSSSSWWPPRHARPPYRRSLSSSRARGANGRTRLTPDIANSPAGRLRRRGLNNLDVTKNTPEWIHNVAWLEISRRDFVQHRREQDEILAADRHHICFASARERSVEVHCGIRPAKPPPAITSLVFTSALTARSPLDRARWLRFANVHRSGRLSPGAAIVVTPDVPGDHVTSVGRQRAVDEDPISSSEAPIRRLVGLHEIDHDAVAVIAHHGH